MLKRIIDLSSKEFDGIKKKDANKELKKLNGQLLSLQIFFYSEGKHALLIILQGIDTSDKDGTICYVFPALIHMDVR